MWIERQRSRTYVLMRTCKMEVGGHGNTVKLMWRNVARKYMKGKGVDEAQDRGTWIMKNAMPRP